MPSALLLQGGGAGIAVLVWLLLTAIYLAVVVWTYNDAKRYSEHPAFLWALVVFFAPILGLLLYFILGRTRR